MWVLLEPGDVAVVPTPSYPIHPRRRRNDQGAAVVERATSTRSKRQSGSATPAPRVLVVSFPHNLTTATATPELMQRLVDLARERELIIVHDFAYADIAFDGHYRAALGTPGRGRGRGARSSSLQPHEVVLDGRQARRLPCRPPPW